MVETNPAVVNISTVQTEQALQPRRNLGSGVLIRNDGYILTNHHVIQNEKGISVLLSDGKVFRGKVVGSDSYSDVALIKIEQKELFPFLPLGNSDKTAIGNWVAAIGNPFGFNNTMTHGIISAKGRVISNELSHKRFDDFLQIDASINPGNSGGPLINLNGEVIGINTAMTASGSGIAFSVPINNVKNILANLYEYGRVKRGWVGLVAQELSSSEELSINWVPRRPKLKIMELVPKSPALIAGLQRGDFILKVNGTPMENLLQLSQQIAMSMPNSILNFVVLRGGSELSMAVKVSELENSQNKAIP